MSNYSTELLDFRKSQFKKGLDKSERRKKSRDVALSLRKNRREERLKQSRKSNEESEPTITLNSINPNNLNSSDPDVVLKCLKQIRKYSHDKIALFVNHEGTEGYYDSVLNF